jgi:ERF superfamily protein
VSEEATIHELMARVMGDIDAVAKNDRNTQQNFSFRGIDAVVNAVGPVLRKHGVVMLPTAGDAALDYYESRNGARMAHCLLPVTFTFYGLAGDSVSCKVVGEASDAGDKVLSKAHSVAWRIALLECFAIPTDDPDPDSQSHERAATPPAAPEPDIDWHALDWPSQAAYDEAYEKAATAARDLPPESQDEVKKFLSDKPRPFSREVIDQWQKEVDDRMPF